MLKNFFRRYVPDRAWVREKRYLRWTGKWLHHPNLWHLNRDSVAGGLAIGLFAGLIPGPLQMLVAAALAIPLRRNLPLALVTTFYTNPFTIVPLYVLAYGYGRLLLGEANHPARVEPFLWNWADWFGSARALLDWTIGLGPPLALGLVALALTLALLGYVTVQIAWRAFVVISWRQRQQKRKQNNTAA